MNLLSLINIEFKKIKRSHIIWIIIIPIVILWIPAIINSNMNFEMQAEGISPENNFFIQSFIGLAWFMYLHWLLVQYCLIKRNEAIKVY